jgi:predicted acyltransferase
VSERRARLASLDALRGFDMLWIVGGREIVVALAAWTGWSGLRALEQQLHHAAWHGFTLWDLVFPLFLFLAGTSFAFSLAAQRARGAGERSIALRVALRALLLVALGVLYNAGRALDFGDARYASVLGRIGLAWGGAALIALCCGPRGRMAWFLGLLLGYGALLVLVPAPGEAQASLEPGRTIVDWFDRRFLPGRLHRGVRDPEGWLATLPAIATALSGLWAGEVLRCEPAPARRLQRLAGAALAALLATWLLARWIPLNKNLWSSSFVTLTTAMSLGLLALFHAAFDLRGWQRVSWPLRAIGANAIGAYMLWRMVDFPAAARAVVGDSPAPGARVAAACAAFALLWLLLAGLYHRRWFLRV